jgi:hypothetical protein
MNKPLIKAENDMIDLFELYPFKDFSMRQLILELSKLNNKEPEIRAAFWTLMASNFLKYGNGPTAKLNI